MNIYFQRIFIASWAIPLVWLFGVPINAMVSGKFMHHVRIGVAFTKLLWTGEKQCTR